MAEINQSQLHLNLKKRKIEDIEDTCIQFTSINIASSQNPPLTSENINQMHTTKMLPSAYLDGLSDDDYEENLLTIQVPHVDQYISLLLKNSQFWNLSGSNLTTFPDYACTDGKISLTKNFVTLNMNTQSCNSCKSRNCNHSLAFEQCISFITLNVVDAILINGSACYPINSNVIILVNNAIDIHLYRFHENKWYCNTCEKFCKFKSVIQTLPENFLAQRTATFNFKFQPECISTMPIPLTLNKFLSEVYEGQMLNGFILPYDLIPENISQQCKFGFEYTESNLNLENTGVIVYLENDIHQLNNHKVYSSTCTGPCQCKAVYDGQKSLLLNLNDKYFVHYGLLFEYSELMTVSRNPLYSYLKAKNNKLARMGRTLKYHYHIIQQAWNCYLRKIEINYEYNFTCDICKDRPSIIILDGIAMGTTKQLPEPPNYIDEKQILPIVPISKRVFIDDGILRKTLIQYADTGLNIPHFDTMIADLKIPEFSSFINISSQLSGSLKIVEKSLTLVLQTIKLLARPEPITAIFRLSSLSSKERKVITELSLGETTSLNCLSDIYNKCSNLYTLINSIPPIIDNEERTISLQVNVAHLLMRILKKINQLIKHPSRVPIENNYSADQNFFSYFPGLKNNYMIPNYESNLAENSCTKIYPKHKRFSPGLLAVTCQHQKCYGFEIMTSRESTIMIFNMLLRKFKDPPRVIVYDNACNLCTTCLMRDPALFSKTTFLVDRFHNTNHQCDPIFSMKTLKTDEIQHLNSQSCEQLFSALRRISTQIAYMRFDNLFFNTRYFLACWNMRTK